MHLPDGILPPYLTVIGYGITGGMTWYSLRKINRTKNPQEKIPKASLLTATFFVTSLIHIPVPPTSIHLILNGLMGIVLGYYAFPAIVIGLFFQAVMFQHGGLSTLGINAAMMGIPAIFAYYIFQLKYLLGNRPFVTQIFSFLAGASALGVSAAIFIIITITNIPADIDTNIEKNAILASLIGYSVQMLIEGIFTVMLITFLEKVKPEILENNFSK
jgi:cobalt/nickel transport system permease protein